MTAITKAHFAKVVNDAVQSLTSMPDDLWKSGFPIIKITVSSLKGEGRDTVVVGVEEADSDDELA